MKYIIGQKIKDFTVVGIINGSAYVSIFPNYNYSNWDKADNKWRLRNVYLVHFDTPRKNLTIEDLQNLYPEKEYCDIEILYQSVPLYQAQWYVEEIMDKEATESTINEN